VISPDWTTFGNSLSFFKKPLMLSWVLSLWSPKLHWTIAMIRRADGHFGRDDPCVSLGFPTTSFGLFPSLASTTEQKFFVVYLRCETCTYRATIFLLPFRSSHHRRRPWLVLPLAILWCVYSWNEFHWQSSLDCESTQGPRSIFGGNGCNHVSAFLKYLRRVLIVTSILTSILIIAFVWSILAASTMVRLVRILGSATDFCSAESILAPL